MRALHKMALVMLCLAPGLSQGAGGGGFIEAAHNDLGNTASLQRGAKYFVNYCAGCHSAQYVRYNRLADDLGLTETQLLDNLMFAAEKPHETITIAMPGDDARRWFGRTPPDLSLSARSRGTDWLYSYLKTFYLDDSKLFGVNNLVLPGASMPHVLWELQGFQKAVYEDHERPDGSSRKTFSHFEMQTEGLLTAEEYDRTVRDLVNFLAYVSEPVQADRKALGIRVLAFLLLFFILAYALKKEFWKDIH